MLLLKRYGFGLLPFLLTVPTDGFSQELGDLAPSFDSSIIAEPEPARASLSLEVGSGFAFFDDLRIPENSGISPTSLNKDEVRSYRGVPLRLALNYERVFDEITNDLKLSYFTVSNTTDSQGDDARNSKYSNLRLANTVQYKISKYRTTTTSLLGGLAIERNTYSTDMSASHMLDSISPIIGLGVVLTENTKAEIFYQRSLASKFGYSQNKNLRSQKIAGSKATVSEFGFDVIHRLSHNANFNFGFSRETAEIQIADLRAYQGFGLEIPPSSQESRHYNLNVMSLKLGLTKVFF